MKTPLTASWTVLRNTEILNIIGKSGRNETINTQIQTEKMRGNTDYESNVTSRS